MRSIARAALVAAAAMGSVAAPAQIYRCEEGGRSVFADKPCPGGGSVTKAAPGGTQGNLQFNVATRHYTVNGADGRAVYMAMKTQNPGGFAGWARWRVSYRYEPKEHAGQCTLAQVQVKVDGEILMPQWPQLNEARQRDQEWWRQMYAELLRHEEGHVQHGREFAMFLKERLMGMGAMPCSEVESRARQEYTRLYDNLQHRDQDYDRRTHHGLRQDNPD